MKAVFATFQPAADCLLRYAPRWFLAVITFHVVGDPPRDIQHPEALRPLFAIA
tara:strand:- start:2685 stop:2843 length:159 start_codon:yes stop_codon:yes gene_type:complete